MKRIDIVIINGKPRSGKDTVIDFMRRYCSINECAVFRSYSTIDPVKDVLRILGWNGEKTDDVRNLLSSLKQFWINNNDGPLKYCMDKILSEAMNKNNDDVILVFQIREPEEIEKLINAIKPIKQAYGLNCKTLFVNRSKVEEEQYGNSSDNDVHEYQYNTEIYNDGTLKELEQMVYNYIEVILKYGGNENE